MWIQKLKAGAMKLASTLGMLAAIQHIKAQTSNGE